MAAGLAFGCSGEGERLNPVFTLGAAVACTVLVLAGLVYAFSRKPHPSPVSPVHLFLHLLHSPIPVPAAAPTRQREPSPKTPSLPSADLYLPPVPGTVMQNLLPPVRSGLNLSMGIPSPTVPPPPGPGPHPFNPYSDLNRALNAPRKPLALKNGQSFRSEYGYSITKIDGHCYMKQALQGFSLSPSVHPHVISRVPCPGDYHPSMAEELKAWAKKWRKRHSGRN